MALQNKKKEATINLLTSLNGLAWRQIEHAADKLADEEDGFSKVLQMLDACFKYNEKVEMPRAFEKFFFSLHRRPDQTLLSYTTEHREHLREIEKYGVKILTAVAGGLTSQSWIDNGAKANGPNQCWIIHGWGEDWRSDVPAVWPGLSQVPQRASRGFRGKGVPRWNARKSASVYVTSEDATEEIEYEYEPDEVYVLDKNEAFDYDMDDAGTPWETEELYWNDETWDESAYYEQEADYPQDEEYEEIYATYLDARRRFADIKAARGFWPVMAVPPSSSPSTSRLPMLLPKENPPKERGRRKR